MLCRGPLGARGWYKPQSLWSVHGQCDPRFIPSYSFGASPPYQYTTLYCSVTEAGLLDIAEGIYKTDGSHHLSITIPTSTSHACTLERAYA